MTDAFFVADVGNTRIKLGRCSLDGPIEGVAVPPDDPQQWEHALSAWAGPASWTIAGVHPNRRDRFAEWLRQRGHTVRVLTDFRDLPIRVDVEAPERVGIDRLLNAVAVVPHIPAGKRAVIIDAGSAVTVDLVEREGIFRGGAIFPGLRLMARALHDHTAQLPLVEDVRDLQPVLPGRNTGAAISAGIAFAVAGGVERLIAEYERSFGRLWLAMAGGDGERLRLLHYNPDVVNPWLTLEGIRQTVRQQP